jgi:aromatic ring-opening dioxygenase catalytic subunit (LigB family)
MSSDPSKGITRRQALMVGMAGAAAVGAGAAGRSGASSGRMPVAFIPHGGGPWPFVDLGFDRAEQDALAAYLTSLHAVPRQPPKALLVISAHWEAPVPTLMTAASPPLPPPAREERLVAWAKAPAARLAHPREEHLLPLMVVVGAAGADAATVAFAGDFMGVPLSAYHLG